MVSRVAFVVNASSGPELSGGRTDANKVYSMLMDEAKGACDPNKSPGPMLDCGSAYEFSKTLNEFLDQFDFNDQLIFYFSGHGKYRNGRYSLCFGYPKEEYFIFDNLMNEISARGIRKAILILDACYSGDPAEKGVKNQSVNYEEQEGNLPEGIVVMSSSNSIQTSNEHPEIPVSIFTFLLCEAIDSGLGGQPTLSGNINVDDAILYVKKRIRSDKTLSPFQQTPVWASSGTEGSVWLAKNKSGKISKKVKHRSVAVASESDLKLAYQNTIPARHPCQGSTISDLEEKYLLKFALRSGLVREGEPHTKADLINVANVLSPIPTLGESIPHKAAVLCFCERPDKFVPQARAMFAFFDGASDEKDVRQVYGPVHIQIQELTRLTMDALNQKTVISETGERIQSQEVSREIVREAISNAIVHRDYNSPEIVRVYVRTNEIKISNPGSFPEGTDWKNFLETEDLSRPNDEAIAYYVTNQLLYEGIGNGFRLFRSVLDEYGESALQWQIKRNQSVAISIRRLKPAVIRHFQNEYFNALDGRLKRQASLMRQDVNWLEEIPIKTRSQSSSGTRRSEIGKRNELFNTQLSLLLGEPASGKTTIVTEFAQELIDNIEHPETMPILVTLRNISSFDRSFISQIEDYIQNQLSIDPPRHYIRDVLRAGDAVLILDGLDEITNSRKTEFLLSELEAFVSEFPTAKIIITSRYLPNVEKRLVKFGFQVFEVLSLDSDQIVEALSKRLPNITDETLNTLIDSGLLKDFGSPFMFSLLASVVTEKGTFPHSKHEFMRSYINAVLDRESSKQLQSSFRFREDLVSVFARIAEFIYLEGSLEFSSEQMRMIIADFVYEKAKVRDTSTYAFEEILYSTAIVSPLTIFRNENSYSFIHKSFLEYFYAVHICDRSLDDKLFTKQIAKVFYDTRSHEVVEYALGIWLQRYPEKKSKARLFAAKLLSNLSSDSNEKQILEKVVSNLTE